MFLASDSVQLEEGVGIACCTVTETIPFPEQSSSPDYFTTLHCSIKIGGTTKHLHRTDRVEYIGDEVMSLQVVLRFAKLAHMQAHTHTHLISASK